MFRLRRKENHKQERKQESTGSEQLMKATGEKLIRQTTINGITVNFYQKTA